MKSMPESSWRKLELRARVVATFLRLGIEGIILDRLYHRQ